MELQEIPASSVSPSGWQQVARSHTELFDGKNLPSENATTVPPNAQTKGLDSSPSLTPHPHLAPCDTAMWVHPPHHLTFVWRTVQFPKKASCFQLCSLLSVFLKLYFKT